MLESLPLWAIAMGVVALVIALGLYFRVKSAPEGNEQMARIARYIREGAMAFLREQQGQGGSQPVPPLPGSD